jgi:predicted secreted protein
MQHHRLTAFLAVFWLSLPLCTQALAAGGNEGTEISLQASGDAEAPNDWHVATLFAEQSATTPGEAQKAVQARIQAGLAAVRAFATVKAQTGTSFAESLLDGKGKPASWRARSEFSIESGDAEAFALALGKLSQSLGIESVASVPSPESRQKAEDAAIGLAMARFRARAKLVSGLMGQGYAIEKLDVFADGRVPLLRSRAMAMDAGSAAPAPLESGSTRVEARISGTVRLSGQARQGGLQ